MLRDLGGSAGAPRRHVSDGRAELILSSSCFFSSPSFSARSLSRSTASSSFVGLVAFSGSGKGLWPMVRKMGVIWVCLRLNACTTGADYDGNTWGSKISCSLYTGALCEARVTFEASAMDTWLWVIKECDNSHQVIEHSKPEKLMMCLWRSFMSPANSPSRWRIHILRELCLAWADLHISPKPNCKPIQFPFPHYLHTLSTSSVKSGWQSLCTFATSYSNAA